MRDSLNALRCYYILYEPHFFKTFYIIWFSACFQRSLQIRPSFPNRDMFGRSVWTVRAEGRFFENVRSRSSENSCICTHGEPDGPCIVCLPSQYPLSVPPVVCGYMSSMDAQVGLACISGPWYAEVGLLAAVHLAKSIPFESRYRQCNTMRF